MLRSPTEDFGDDREKAFEGNNGNPSGTLGNADTWHAKRTLFATPLLIVSVLFTFTQCGVVGGKKSEEAPWMLLASGINEQTPAINTGGGNYYGGNSSSGGGGNSSLVPVTGMYFLHPASFAEHQRAKRRPARFFPSEKRGVDHLGSITMITDGNGNVVTGRNNEGKSHISYKPYGDILRTDSYGPDISKFKYTGQEEDKESSLLYYKARYYDPVIGRFLQADSVIMPERIFGMNRYMYVEGSPVNYRDSSGHKMNQAMTNAIIGFFVASQTGQDPVAGAALGYMIGYKEYKAQKKMTNAKYAAGAAIAITSMAIGFYGAQAIQKSIYAVNPVSGLPMAASSMMPGTFGQFIAERILNAGLGTIEKRLSGDIGYKLFKNDVGRELGKNASSFGSGVGNLLGGIDAEIGTKDIEISSTQSITVVTGEVDLSGAANYAIEDYIGCKYFEGGGDCRTIKWKNKKNFGELK